MNIDNTRVFRPNQLSSLILVSVFLSFQVWFIFTGYNNGWTYIKNNLVGLLIFECIVFLYLSFALAVSTEKIVVTSDAILRTNIYRKQKILINSIKRVSKRSTGRGGYTIDIVMDSSGASIGLSLSEDKIDKAISYILEQIRISNPEYFSLLKDDQSYQVERFWHK